MSHQSIKLHMRDRKSRPIISDPFTSYKLLQSGVLRVDQSKFSYCALFHDRASELVLHIFTDPNINGQNPDQVQIPPPPGYTESGERLTDVVFCPSLWLTN